MYDCVCAFIPVNSKRACVCRCDYKTQLPALKTHVCMHVNNIKEMISKED